MMPADWLHVRSEILKQLSPWLALPYQQGVLRPRLTFVVDVHIVLDELAGRIRASKPDYRTNLSESLDAGVIEIVAPTETVEQLERSLDRYCQDRDLSPHRMREEWNAYRPTLILRAAGDLDRDELKELAAVDRDDVPFAALVSELGARALLSRDKHFDKVPGITAKRTEVRELLIDLRDYARHAAVSVVAKNVSQTLVIGIGGAGMMSVKGVSALSRLPPVVQLALGVGAVVLLCNDDARAKIGGGLHTLVKLLAAGSERLVEASAAANEAEAAANAAWSRVDQRLPAAKTRPKMSEVVHRILAFSSTPMTVPGIVAALHAHGYKTEARRLGPSVTRALRRDARLVQAADGEWTVRG
jgi:predicted nucleic acid-binding protein